MTNKRSEKENLPITLAFRVTDETDEAIQKIMAKERRIQAEVCRALIERGVAAYRRDKALFEPDSHSAGRKP